MHTVLYLKTPLCAQPGGCAGEVVRRGAQGCALCWCEGSARSNAWLCAWLCAEVVCRVVRKTFGTTPLHKPKWLGALRCTTFQAL